MVSSHNGLAFVGDLHAGRSPYAHLPRMRGDSRYALEQIVDICRRRDLDLVFLGDTFDSRFPEPDVVGGVLHTIADVSVAHIVGQHDMHEYTWLDVAPADNIRLRLKPGERYIMGGINIAGFDFAPRPRLMENLAAVPRGTEILCLHQMLTDVAPMGNGQLAANELPDYVSITALGDWHGLPQDGESEGRKWFYTGSMTLRSYNEPAAKSFVVVTRDSHGALQVERVPIHTRPVIRGDLLDIDDVETWLSSAEQAIRQAREQARSLNVPDAVAIPFVAVRYNVEIEGVYDKIMAVLQSLSDGGEAFVHLVPNRKFVQAQPDCEALATSDIRVDTVISELIDRSISPELHGLVTELAYAPAPKDVIDSYKAQQGVVDDPLRV